MEDLDSGFVFSLITDSCCFWAKLSIYINIICMQDKKLWTISHMEHSSNTRPEPSQLQPSNQRHGTVARTIKCSAALGLNNFKAASNGCNEGGQGHFRGARNGSPGLVWKSPGNTTHTQRERYIYTYVYNYIIFYSIILNYIISYIIYIIL